MSEANNPQVLLITNQGEIEITLDAENAPKTVKNFLDYVESGFYDQTIFHRVIPNFMIQGGGFTPEMEQKSTNETIDNEANNGLKNTVGAIAMARTSAPHSASSQFFINVADNQFLDFTSESPQGWGYAVFGNVTKGLDTVMEIAKASTGNHGPHQDVPVESIVIESAKVIDA